MEKVLNELKEYIEGLEVDENIQDVSELKTVEEKYNYNCNLFISYANNNDVIEKLRNFINELESINEKQFKSNIVNSYDMNDEELTGFCD